MRKKTDTKTEDGFLNRWSEKKTQTDNPPAQAPDVIDRDDIIKKQNPVEMDAESPQPGDQLDDVPALTDEDMPDLETLDEKSDFSGFLSPGVSEELRKLALRKLFRSKVFNVRDGLDDYDDDFRNFAALGDIITSDMKHQMELAEERKKEREEQERLAREEQLALEESDDGVADDQASEDQDKQDQDREDQQTYAENSENEDDKQKNETSAIEPGNKQDPQPG